MGLLDIIFKPKVDKEQIVKELSDPGRKVMRAMFQYLGSQIPVWKEANTINFVENGYNINYLVYAIVQWKAQKAAQIDFEVIQNVRGKEVVLEDHELLKVLYEPNSYQGKQEFFEQAYGFKFLDGNSYIYTPILKSGVNKGKITEMHVLPSPITEIVTGTDFNPIGGYRVIYSPDKRSDFEADEVLHFKYANYDATDLSYLYGISPVQAAWRNIQKSNSNINASKSSFDNMGALGILFQKDQDLAALLTDEQRKKAQYQLDRKVRGTDNKGRIVNSVGDYGYINFGANPVDLALIEDAKMTRDELCTVFHVNPAIFGAMENSSYNNLTEARKISYIDGVLPEVKSFLDEFNKNITPAYGSNIEVRMVTKNIPEMQADLKDMVSWLKDAYWMKENEKREAMGLEPLPNMDVVNIPSNLLPNDDLSNIM